MTRLTITTLDKPCKCCGQKSGSGPVISDIIEFALTPRNNLPQVIVLQITEAIKNGKAMELTPCD